MSSKTPKEDFDRFGNYIDAMTDIEYDYWYDNEASSKQKALADTIREEVQEDEAPEEIEENRRSIMGFFRRLFRRK
jgi:hypothetical protein